MASALNLAPVHPGTTRPSRAAVAIAWAGIAAAVFAGAISALAAAHPGALRSAAAFTILLALLGVALWRPAAGVQMTFIFLVVLAFLRRLLILPGGWASLDPLLLVGPLVVVALAARLFLLGRRPLARDGISRLALVVLALAIVEIVNPASGGLRGNIGGLFLLGVPLLWFFVGRELASDGLTRNLLVLAVVLSLADGLYGLVQTQVGFPPWDVAWLNVNGYTSLHVGNQIRAFGSFSSGQEYTLFVGSGLAIAGAFLARRRLLAAIPIPVLAVALFFASGRAAVVTSFLAIVIAFAIAPRRARAAGLVIGLAVIAAYGGIKLAGGAAGSTNSLISHQAGGLTNPLNPGQSTLLAHLGELIHGIGYGFAHPLGAGTGATNQGGYKLGGSGGLLATEVDLSNAFVGLGLLGGFAYLALVVGVLARAFRGWFAGHELMLPVIAVLVVSLGQWLEGGLYALGPFVWLLIGWVVRTTNADVAAAARREPEDPGLALSSVFPSAPEAAFPASVRPF